MKYDNVFYFSHINSIGGCESFFYYLSLKYKNLVIFYKEGDWRQIERLAKNVEVIKYTGQQIKCKRFFCCYNPDIIDNVEAEEYIHIIHCDYKAVWFSPIRHPKFTKYIGVSQLVCDSFEEITGEKAECIYNPIVVKKPNVKRKNDSKLHLISATRLTKEKGFKKMEKLADLLDRAGIDYEWLVYTNRPKNKFGKGVVYKDPKLDITEDIAKADYLVQLSDGEAYCYSVVESLSVGTPVIVTDLPVYKELGLNEENSIKWNNIDVKNVQKRSETFSYTPPKDNWGKYLKGDRGYNPLEMIEVKPKISYIDTWLNRRIQKGEVVKMPKYRVSILEAKPIRIGMFGLVERV